MSVDRVATSAQTAYFLSQIQSAGSALDQTQEQIAAQFLHLGIWESVISNGLIAEVEQQVD